MKDSTLIRKIDEWLVRAQGLVERLTIARDILMEVQEPERQLRLVQKVNGAMAAHLSGSAHVAETPRRQDASLSAAVREVIAAEGPLSSSDVLQRLQRSYLGPTVLTGKAVSGRLTKMKQKDIVTDAEGRWSLTRTPVRRPGNQAGWKPPAKQNKTNGGKRPPGERAIDAVMRALVAAPGPLSATDLRARVSEMPATVVASAFSTGVRYGRLRQTANGWVITAKGRKEVAQLNGQPS